MKGMLIKLVTLFLSRHSDGWYRAEMRSVSGDDVKQRNTTTNEDHTAGGMPLPPLLTVFPPKPASMHALPILSHSQDQSTCFSHGLHGCSFGLLHFEQD